MIWNVNENVVLVAPEYGGSIVFVSIVKVEWVRCIKEKMKIKKFIKNNWISMYNKFIDLR